jgi:hypothetical protein
LRIVLCRSLRVTTVQRISIGAGHAKIRLPYVWRLGGIGGMLCGYGHEVGSAAMTATISGTATVEEMPTNACQVFYTCPSCPARLRPLAGDCCVFCSYSDQRCPPKQADQPSC